MTRAGARDAPVLLLPGLPSDESRSMKRYAAELHAALAARNGPPIMMERPPDCRCVSRAVDWRQAHRVDRAWCRWVAYPRSLTEREAGLFHILDQGYTHLIRSVDPDRTVVTCHDVIPLLAAEGAIPMTASARAAWIFRYKVACLVRARRIIAVTAATKATLERYTAVDSRRIVVVPHGVNATFRVLPHARSARRAAAGIGHTMRVVLQVATASRYKNTPALLRAVARLRARLSGVVLVRIGVPLFPDEADLARRLGVIECLRYLGDVATDELLAEWYNAADLLLFPSSWEGFGWPPLEAMACGTPVVASTTPAITEVTGTAALLAAPDDPAAIAAATERVLTDPALAADLRERGFRRAAQFTWAATAARTAAVYAELLEEPATAAPHAERRA